MLGSNLNNLINDITSTFMGLYDGCVSNKLPIREKTHIVLFHAINKPVLPDRPDYTH